MHADTAQLLLDSKADVNTQNKKGDTPLHAASRMGSLELVQILIDAGAKAKVKNEKGKSPQQVVCDEAIPPCTKDMTKAIKELLQ